MMLDFRKIKKSVEGLASQVGALKEKIELLKRKREDISTAAAAKVDIKQLLTRLVAERAATHERNFATLMHQFARKPSSVNSAPGMQQSLLIGAPQPGIASSATTLEQGLCAVLGDLVLSGLLRQVDEMPWPDEGAPMAERAPLLAKLDREIGELERELAELNGSARAAGIFIE